MLENSNVAVGDHPVAATGRRVEITYRSIGDLKLNPNNPRQHDKRQIQQISRSIAAFQFNVPVLVDSELVVIAGHGRIQAARELGLNEIPTICLDHLTEIQVKAFTIADNRLTENSTWNDQLLAEQFKVLSECDLSFDIEATGFELAEIDMRIESANAREEWNDSIDAVLHDKIPSITKPGDLWILGNHRLYCGSALEDSSFSILMNGQRAAMIFIDPPYNVPINGNVSGLGKVQHRDFAMACGEMDKDQFIAFLNKVTKQLASHSEEGSIHFVCMDWRHLEEMITATKDVYYELKNLCIWTKDNAGMGSLYRSQHELIFVFKKGDVPHRNFVQLGKYGRNRTNVWKYPSANSFSKTSGEGNLLQLHPTVKPVALIADAIRDCSARGDIILDSFLGSGSTLIAADKVGRICYGVELEPKYVDVAIHRWRTFSKKEAIHASTGKTFETLAQEVTHER